MIKKSHLIFFILFAFSLKTLGNATSTPAILFVHGLAGSHTTWDELIDNLPENFYYYGNMEVAGTSEVIVSPHYPYIKNTEANNLLCFTIDFSDNQNLSFVEQAGELDLIIQLIRKRFGIEKVVLFSHSMGGIACRQYINNYGTDYVAGLVMVTSPNLGSYLGEINEIPGFADYMINQVMEPEAYLNIKNSSVGIIDVVSLLGAGLNVKSKAVSMLAPGSSELAALNSNDFPVDLPLVIVLSKFNPVTNKDRIKREIADYYTTLSNFFAERGRVNSYIEYRKNNVSKNTIDFFSFALQQKFTDGIVSIPSQDIRLAALNGSELNPIYLETNRFHTETNKDILVMHDALLKVTKHKNKAPCLLSDNSKNIGFIIDSSGSMEYNDPSNIRKTALKQISNLINPADNVFLIDFDSDAKWLNPNNWKKWSKSKLSFQIEGIDSKGNTDIGKALNLMKEILTSNCNRTNNTGVLLFTDGKSEYANEAAWYEQNNIPIHIVSYKDNADYGLLRSIAAQTHGEYNQANNEMDVVAGFMNFYYGLSDNDLLCSYENFIHAQDTCIHEFFVDPFSKNLTLILNWLDESLNFQLIDPTGKQKIFNMPDDVLFSSDSYKIATVKNPLKGKWIAKILSNVGSNNSKYLFQANAQSSYKVRIEGKQTQNGPIVLNIKCDNDEIILENADVRATVETQEKKIKDISDRFKNGKFIYLPKNNTGNYIFKINLFATNENGDSISRAFNYSEYVGKLIPGYISSVKNRISNTFIQSEEVLTGGNLVGLKCVIYEAGSSKDNAKAVGIVTTQKKNQLFIEIKDCIANNEIKTNDIIELDIIAWRKD